MPYRFQPGEAVDAAVRRVAREQIDRALAAIHDDDVDADEKVHRVRKQCKKMRGLLRLVRATLPRGVYGRENRAFRDMARRLSPIRDAAVLIETYDGLLERFAHQIDRAGFAPVRELLVERHDRVVDSPPGVAERLALFAEEMADARRRVEEWRVDPGGFDGVSDGLGRTYRRGRRTLATAFRESTPEAFHEWRKRVKYGWYHVRLLRDSWTPLLERRASEAHELSALVGDHHDLMVLRTAVQGAAGRGVPDATRQTLLALVDRRRLELEARARPLGERLFAEKPGAFVDRHARYWEVWRSDEEQDDALRPESRRDRSG